MSNREPSLLRRIYPAVALTGIGFGLVNALDRPAPVSSLASGALAAEDGSATTVVAGADPAQSAATTVPPVPNSVSSQGQKSTPATQAPAAPAAPASTAAPQATPAPVPVTPAPTQAPAVNDCGAIVKTGAAATIALRREYGSLQVTAKFTSAKVLCAANANYSVYESRSNRYNDYSIPILSDQAVAAGSANIQGVSGATATSRAYVNSLQSALDQL